MSDDSLAGRYRDWAGIDYAPVIPALLPEQLLTLLPANARVFDAGCDKGRSTVFLAAHGATAVGVDLNPAAIAAAIRRADDEGMPAATFRVADLLLEPFEQFDAVIATRLLTCLPDPADRARMAKVLYRTVAPGGLLYVDDFLRSDDNAEYARRYVAGAKDGLGEGNFVVPDERGATLFVAHHHSLDEVHRLMKPYDSLLFEQHASRSMRGHAVTMFRFIGRKPLEGIAA